MLTLLLTCKELTGFHDLKRSKCIVINTYTYIHIHFYTVTKRYLNTGRKIDFFSRSHLAPKHFKVVANSKKLVAIMTHTHKNVMKNKPTKFTRATKRTLEWVIYSVKGYLNPRWRLVTIDLRSKSCMYCLLETSLTRNFAADFTNL